MYFHGCYCSRVDKLLSQLSIDGVSLAPVSLVIAVCSRREQSQVSTFGKPLDGVVVVEDLLLCSVYPLQLERHFHCRENDETKLTAVAVVSCFSSYGNIW
jgi:hypothetical protein